MPCGQNQDRAFSVPSLRQDYSGTSTASSATFRYTVSGSPIKELGDKFRCNDDLVGSLTMSAVFQNKPEKDPRVEAAISHWAPRFVANGVPLADFQEVTASVSRWEDWCAAWSARAAVHEEMGNKALAGGYNTSAGAHFTRAAVCYHFGKFLFVNDMAQMKEAHRRAVECRNKALPLLNPPGERVAIPYEGKQLYGNLRKPTAQPSNTGIARPPIAVMCMGLWGVSLGGYYAPRAAAYEKRIKACVALSGPFQRSADFTGRPQMNVEAFRVRSKSANLEEAGKWRCASPSPL